MEYTQLSWKYLLKKNQLFDRIKIILYKDKVFEKR